MEVYPTADKTEAMQFPKYSSKYYCNPADKTEATQFPKGRVCRLISTVQSMEYEQSIQ